MPLHTFWVALVALTTTPTARTWTRTTLGDYLSNVYLGCLCTLWMQVRLISVLACFSFSPSALYIASWTFTNSGCVCNSILYSTVSVGKKWNKQYQWGKYGKTHTLNLCEIGHPFWICITWVGIQHQSGITYGTDYLSIIFPKKDHANKTKTRTNTHALLCHHARLWGYSPKHVLVCWCAWWLVEWV